MKLNCLKQVNLHVLLKHTVSPLKHRTQDVWGMEANLHGLFETQSFIH